jgi:hypothetical protein
MLHKPWKSSSRTLKELCSPAVVQGEQRVDLQKAEEGHVGGETCVLWVTQPWQRRVTQQEAGYLVWSFWDGFCIWLRIGSQREGHCRVLPGLRNEVCYVVLEKAHGSSDQFLIPFWDPPWWRYWAWFLRFIEAGSGKGYRWISAIDVAPVVLCATYA